MPTTTTTTSYDDTYDSKRDDFFDVDGDDFIMKFMDSTCQGFLSNNESSSACLPACNNVLFEQQMEMLTHCRRPLDFMSLFQDQCSSSEPDESYNVIPGVYMTPKDCEYCGAERTQDCDPRICTRPALYFQKKRPPFRKPESSQWDPTTDHAIERRRSSEKKKDDEESKPELLSSGSYFGSFF